MHPSRVLLLVAALAGVLVAMLPVDVATPGSSVPYSCGPIGVVQVVRVAKPAHTDGANKNEDATLNELESRCAGAGLAQGVKGLLVFLAGWALYLALYWALGGPAAPRRAAPDPGWYTPPPPGP